MRVEKSLVTIAERGYHSTIVTSSELNDKEVIVLIAGGFDVKEVLNLPKRSFHVAWNKPEEKGVSKLYKSIKEITKSALRGTAPSHKELFDLYEKNEPKRQRLIGNSANTKAAESIRIDREVRVYKEEVKKNETLAYRCGRITKRVPKALKRTNDGENYNDKSIMVYHRKKLVTAGINIAGMTNKEIYETSIALGKVMHKTKSEAAMRLRKNKNKGGK